MGLLTNEQKRLIKTNLVAFRSIILNNDPTTELEPAPFHDTFSDLLLNGKENVALECYRQSAKSSYVLRAFPLHCLAFPKDTYIVIIKQNQRVASGKLKDIINEYNANPLIRHNKIAIKEESANAFSVDVKDENGETKNVRIEAYGKGAGIRGLNNQDRRPDIVILDDIQDKDDARSDTVVETDWDWFLSDVLFLGTQTRIFMIGNNLGERCILEKCINNADNLGFKTLRIPVEVDGVPSWEAQNTIEQIRKERDDFAKLGKIDIWMMEKMCCAVAEESRVFNSADYRYYSSHMKDNLVNICNVYACFDPASSIKQTSDFRAISITGVDEKNNWFVLDIKYGRWDSAKTIDVIFNVVREYNLRDFYIEKGWYIQVLEPFLMKEMSKRNEFFNVITLEHAKLGSKLERIKMLQPRFKAHTIYFPDDSEWLGELKSEMAGITNTEIKSEHDDLCDSLAMVEQVALPPIAHKGDYKENVLRSIQQKPQSLFEISGY